MISFEKPLFLLLMPAALPAVLHTLRYIQKVRTAYYSKNMRSITRRLYMRAMCRAASWMCLCAAAAIPLHGTRKSTAPHRGVSVVFAIDISRSMTIPDMDSGRLAFAKQYISFITNHIPHALCALVMIKGQGILAVPAGLSRHGFLTAVKNLSPQGATAAGTNLEHGIQTAIHAFPANRTGKKIIVLCTDGDQTAGNLARTVSLLRQENILLITVGFGTKEGGTVSIIDNAGKTSIQHCVLQDTVLKDAAHATGNGSFYTDARETGSVWKIINTIAEQNDINNSPHTVQFLEIPVRRVFECTLAAVIFFCIGQAIGTTYERKKQKNNINT